MEPWNFAWPFGLVVEEGGADGFEGGCQSRLAREKPPMSASDMSLHVDGEEGSWKVVRM